MNTIKITKPAYPPTSRIFNTTWVLALNPDQIFLRPVRQASLPYLKMIGKEGERTVRRLLKIEGVIKVQIKPYSVAVTIADAFNWWSEPTHSLLDREVVVALIKSLPANARNKVHAPAYVWEQ
jgi:hypothetical protein